jgi:two-component sensor histidine kinase
MYSKLKSYFIGGCLETLDSIHDKSRLTLLFNLAFAVTLMGIVSALVSTVIGTYSVYIPALGNIAFGLITLYSIRITKRFTGVAKLYFILLFVLIFGNLNFNHGTMHVGSPFWIMLLNILVLYIVGVYWGVGFILASLIGYLYYLHYVFPYHWNAFRSLSEEVYYSVYYEAFFALFLLFYIIYTILKSSKESDTLLKKKNSELWSQNNEIIVREEEKTIMLKEIHHRVKNNLQVITSLLRLQMHELDNENEIEKFKDSINRVMTMALIHDKMYQSEELSRINLEEYFKGLSRDLINSYQIDFKVDLVFKFKIEKIGLKSIVPLALIYNELFSNSLKHAFVNIENPKIKVSILKYDDNFFQFTYEDNGIWKESEGKSTFGRELIDSLTGQLDGELTFTSIPKTKYEFKFKHLDLE